MLLYHSSHPFVFIYSFKHASHTAIYTLSLHDALPISRITSAINMMMMVFSAMAVGGLVWVLYGYGLSSGDSIAQIVDRKSTRLNSSHVAISYAVFCLKKKRIY